MAPDAPPPTYDAQGNLALGWLLVVRYEPTDGAVTLSWTKDGDLFRRTQQGAQAYLPEDMPEVAEAVRQTLVMLANPSLF